VGADQVVHAPWITQALDDLNMPRCGKENVMMSPIRTPIDKALGERPGIP
jgi:hypothetical protein